MNYGNDRCSTMLRELRRPFCLVIGWRKVLGEQVAEQSRTWLVYPRKSCQIGRIWNFSAWLAAASIAVSPALINRAKAESMTAETSRVFELRVYHVLPGKMPAVEAQFRDAWAQLLDKHNLKVVGYWEAEDN